MHIFCKSRLIYIYKTSQWFIMLTFLMHGFFVTSIAEVKNKNGLGEMVPLGKRPLVTHVNHI